MSNTHTVVTHVSSDEYDRACTEAQSLTAENHGKVIRCTSITGTLDELEPRLRALGFSAIRMMSGPIDLSMADPYGMRRVGSVNIKTERWAAHIWRGMLAYANGRAYLSDAKTADEPFVSGLFELVQS